MENGNRVGEHLGMVAVKEGNHTQVADDIDWCVSQIDYLCLGHVDDYYPIYPKLSSGHCY